MASVQSPLRNLVKPVLFKLLGTRGYLWFQFQGKLRDIQQRLVEEDEMELLPYFVGRDDSTLDIGANYAYYTVRLAEQSPQGTVYAFEPIPPTFEICKRLVKHFKLKNVEVFQKGVGAKADRVQFEVPLQEAGFISAGQAHIAGRNNNLEGREKFHNFSKTERFECEIVAIDQFLPKLERLSFVKIDIEGAEFFALQGMKETLKKFKPVVLIEVCSFFLEGFGIRSEQLFGLIKELQYEVFKYNKTSKKLLGVSSADLSSSPRLDSNFILVHQDSIGKFKELIVHD